MQTRNRFLDDMARLASGTLGLVAGLRTEIEQVVKQQIQRLLGDMDLVGREEFEAVKAMAAKARAEQEAMAKRLEALEVARDEPAPKAARDEPAPKTKRSPRAAD